MRHFESNIVLRGFTLVSILLKALNNLIDLALNVQGRARSNRSDVIKENLFFVVTGVKVTSYPWCSSGCLEFSKKF